jgi:hypothetical protein
VRAEHRDQLRLTCGAFEEATTEYADTDGSAESAKTQHETGCDENDCLCELHDFPLVDG